MYTYCSPSTQSYDSTRSSQATRVHFHCMREYIIKWKQCIAQLIIIMVRVAIKGNSLAYALWLPVYHRNPCSVFWCSGVWLIAVNLISWWHCYHFVHGLCFSNNGLNKLPMNSYLHAILRIINRGVSSLATDFPCGVWGRGLITCLLHDCPIFGQHFKMRVGM